MTAFFRLGLIFIFFHEIESQRVDVNTGRGPLFGYHFSNGDNTSALYYGEGDVFLGVPFVMPPTGSLRFQKPRAILQYPGASPWNATYFRPACPQEALSDDKMSEDCLYLNIFTPNAKSDYKYPVMVWIHGGALKLGYASDFGVAGIIRNLVSRGVVVVTIQYRLGLLGFFTTFTDDFPPNLGMLDQVEALKFVQQEIPNFGGDPFRVTIFGQSAGSASVSAHTYSPISQGLFQQSIQESGTVLTCLEGALGFSGLSIDRAQKLCNFTADMWNTRNYASLKACLQNMDYHEWLKYEPDNVIGWKMAQDNYFLPDVPRNLWQNRPNLPRMIGVVKDEWAAYEIMFMRNNITSFDTYGKAWFELEVDLYASNFMGSQTQTAIDIWENIYLKPGASDDDHMAWLDVSVAAFSAAGFTGFSVKDAEYYVRNNNSPYVYEFTWSTMVGQNYNVPGWHPVPHASELPLIFMQEWDWNKALAENKVNQTDIDLANFFGEAWTNFAKYGRPTLTPDWKPSKNYMLNDMEYFEIGQNRGMRTGFRTKDKINWDQVMPAIIGVLPPEMPDYNNGSTITSTSVRRNTFLSELARMQMTFKN